MGRRRFRFLLLTASLAATAARADVDSALRDAAARIDFGWFTEDAALIASAGASLAGHSGGLWRDYLLAYAAYREAGLTQAGGCDAGPMLEACERHGEAAARSSQTEAEATILIAACAALAARAEPLRSVLHQRRLRQALARAAAIDAGNPRLLLVTARYAHQEGQGASNPFAAAVAAFRAYAGRYELPSWGEAEALALASRHRLDAGDLRAARDLLEEALLIAPDYAEALAIRHRLLARAAAD